MVKKYIELPGAPLSKAILCKPKTIMEISGQIGVNEDKKLVEGIEAQTKQTLENIKKNLNEVGWTFENVIKVRIYLVNMGDYETINHIYKEYFSEKYPTRAAIGVKALPLNALIEIECTAIED